MLAQNFKTATDLMLSEKEKGALVLVLGMLERGELRHVSPNNSRPMAGCEFTGHFNMSNWQDQADCGTVCCIGGAAELLGKVDFNFSNNRPLEMLFWADYQHKLSDITVEQAARALRSYLTTGAANWADALSVPAEGTAR